jgi:DNA processing protein
MPRGDWAPERIDAWLALSEAPGLGRATARDLLHRYGDPQAVLRGDRSLDASLTPDQADRLLAVRRRDRRALVERTAQWLAAGDHHLIALGDPGYPAELMLRPDPPLLLHAAGSLEALRRPQLAIVGSRDATPQGRDIAHQFAAHLARRGITIVSGLALGIDACAHEGALEGGAPGEPATIAVVGTGLDRCHPRRHAALARRVADAGLLLSEFPLGTEAHPLHFPLRNRLIAHLAAGTLVVEAAPASGSLITARQAVDAGREVMAVPGSILSPQARGCHGLIRDGATLVETPDQVLELLGGRDGWPPAPPPPRRVPANRRSSRGASTPPDESGGTAVVTEAANDDFLDLAPWPEDATAAQRNVLRALGLDPQGMDVLVHRTGMSPQELSAHLLTMELNAWVARVPGGRYQRRGVRR